MLNDLVDLLSRISVELVSFESPDSNYSFSLYLPNGEKWNIVSGKSPTVGNLQEAMNNNIFILNHTALDRFLSGKSNPQVETLSGEWRVEGETEDLIVISQAIYNAYQKKD